MKNEILTFFRRHSSVFTWGGFFLVLLTGLSAVNGGNFWMAAIGVLTLTGVVVLTRSNRGVVAPALIALASIVAASLAAQLFLFFDFTGIASVSLLAGVLVAGLLATSLSLEFPRPASRWSTFFWSMIMAFAVAYLSVTSGVLSSFPRMSTGIVSGVSFLFVYCILYYGPFIRFVYRNMPEGVVEDSYLSRRIAKWLERGDADFVQGEDFFTVWSNSADDEKAYGFTLIPIRAEESLSSVKRRKGNMVSYRGRPVNNWMLTEVYKKSSRGVHKGSHFTPIFVDVLNNVKSEKLFLSLPTTNKVLGVGVITSKKLIETKNPHTYLSNKYSEISFPLTPKKRAELASLVEVEEDSEPEVEEESSIA